MTANGAFETTVSFNAAPDDIRNSASIHHRVLRRSKSVGRAPRCNAISISTSNDMPPRAGFQGPGWCWSPRSGRRKASMYGDITWAYVFRRTNPSQISNSPTPSTAPATPPNSDTFSGCTCIIMIELAVPAQRYRTHAERLSQRDGGSPSQNESSLHTLYRTAALPRAVRVDHPSTAACIARLAEHIASPGQPHFCNRPAVSSMAFLHSSRVTSGNEVSRPSRSTR